MSNKLRFALIAAVAFAVGIVLAMSRDTPMATGPDEIRLDRETCERCAMVVSDPYYATQIRRPATENEASRTYKFDDLGCAMFWFDQQAWKDDEGVEIWVADYRNGNWLDAQSAVFVPNRVTPMGYGLGAQAEPADNGMDFAAARKRLAMFESAKSPHAHHHHHQ